MENKLEITFCDTIEIPLVFDGMINIGFSLFNSNGGAFFLPEHDDDEFDYVSGMDITYSELLLICEKRWAHKRVIGVGTWFNEEFIHMLFIHPNVMIFSLEGEENCLEGRIKDYNYYIKNFLPLSQHIRIERMVCDMIFSG